MTHEEGPKERPSVVGWREWVSFPDLDLPRMKAKIDTGARTSALHAFDVERSVSGGVDVVTFAVHPHQRDDETSIIVSAPVTDEREITSSNGQTELRPVIETVVRLGTREWPIEMTLTNRDNMGFRLLLGRTALAGQWHVDPGRSYLQGKRKPANSSPTTSVPTTESKATL